MDNLVLKSACESCGSPSDLYGINCKHATLCLSCGKSMALAGVLCRICGAPITNLIREYNVRAASASDKSFFIGRFVTGLPPFSKKKSAENKWSLHKDGLQGRQLTDVLRDKYRNKPWILEDETGQHQFQGHIEGSQSATATYYLLMLQGREFVAIPAGNWYNFSKIAQYKQLTLEEAEEKMNKRKSNATGYERWMMKAATNGAAAFGSEAKKTEGTAGVETDAGRPKKGKSSEDGHTSDKGEEDEEAEAARKNRLGLTKKSMDDDEEGGKADDNDFDDADSEKGDHWDNDEYFTDDDEAVGNNPEEREDLAPEIPAPPEIKQDDEEEEDNGGLSTSGKEIKKLLGKSSARLNESDAEEDYNNDDEDDEASMSPVLAPKLKEALAEDSTDNSISKSTPSNSRSMTAGAKSAKSKRKTEQDDVKPPQNATPTKKMKTDTDMKSLAVEDETKPSVAGKASSSSSSRLAPSPIAPVTEEEIRTVLMEVAPVTTTDLVARFKARLKTKEDKSAFADILRKISKIQKTNGNNYVVLR